MQTEADAREEESDFIRFFSGPIYADVHEHFLSV